MIVDSHCHLDRLKLDKLPEATISQVVKEAQEAGVSHMLCVGIDMSNADAVKSIAAEHENVYASVGVHPSDVSQLISADELVACANHPKVVAIGETGLDYYYTKDTAQVQQESLVMHLDVAKQLELPTIIHTREAKQDTLDILDKHACRSARGVLHCFTEDLDMAMQAIDLGFYVSFSGIVTFKNAVELQEVAKNIPLERMLVETDSPYLTPVPYRGKPNFPKHTADVARFIAELRGIDFDAVAEVTTHNFFELFPRAKSIQ